MIPKIIHYCWFGSKELPELEKKCIETWKRLLPDYRIILWNEDNIDINSCAYVQQAYQQKKYAFVSDYARVKVLYEYGGIYLDTDVEVLKTFDSLLDCDSFLGFENKTFIGTAVIGASKNSAFIKKMLDYYYRTPFVDSHGSENLTTNVTLLDNILVSMGLQKNNSRQQLQNIEIYPRTIFYPKKVSETTFNVTADSVTIHHMNATWLTERQRRRGTNKFWINVCRPVLRFAKNIIINLLGSERTKRIEIRIRNFLK